MVQAIFTNRKSFFQSDGASIYQYGFSRANFTFTDMTKSDLFDPRQTSKDNKPYCMGQQSPLYTVNISLNNRLPLVSR